jgi:hypothetical protein
MLHKKAANNRDNTTSQRAKKKKYICCEFVVQVLQDLGIVARKHMASSYTPREILYGALPCAECYAFKAPVRLTAPFSSH